MFIDQWHSIQPKQLSHENHLTAWCMVLIDWKMWLHSLLAKAAFIFLDIIKRTHMKGIQQHNPDGMKIMMIQCDSQKIQKQLYF